MGARRADSDSAREGREGRDVRADGVTAADITDGLHLGDALRHRRSRPSAGAIFTSVAVHAVALATFFFAGIGMRHDAIEYHRVAIHLVSPPPTELGPPQPVQTTSVVAAAPKVEAKKVEKVTKPKTQTQSATNDKVVSTPKNAKPATGAHPKPGAVGGEDLNIQQAGENFPYPDYLDHVIKVLLQYFRWDKTPNLTAEITFFIRRDGTVGGVNLKRGSGNLEFDVAATGAVENAGRQKAMGPLPKGWQGDKLQIDYTFAPSNQ